MVTRDTRFKLVDGYNLQIGGVRIQDAGDYVCQIGDQDARDQVHTVEILVPPSVRPVPQNGQITARKGSSVTLECKASGNPVPNLYWHKKVRNICASPYASFSFFFLFHQPTDQSTILTQRLSFPRFASDSLFFCEKFKSNLGSVWLLVSLFFSVN